MVANILNMSVFNDGQPFCCKVVASTPEINGYYAANLNSEVLTVKSANPNAFLFAFINYPVRPE
jgi:hypothetical protein